MPKIYLVTTCAFFLGVFAGLSDTTYVLQEDFGNTASFFDKFTFYTEPDPTHGFVQYVDQAAAEAAGLIRIKDDSVYMDVDYTNVVDDGGRKSVRLTSKTAFNHGLIILDLTHMPGNVCAGGEIDIIEGVSLLGNNAVALHTTTGCSINDTGFTGEVQTTNCYIRAPGQGNNVGCGIKIPSTKSYGDGFNNAGGGVYATEWTASGFKTWFFGHDAVPTDISAGQPDPLSWPTPDAAFAGDCNFERHFWDMQIVFDITFCGDWAGNPDVWASSGNCPTLATSCPDYVGNNPAEFEKAYWEIVSLKVYQDVNGTETVGKGISPFTSRSRVIRGAMP